MIEGAKETMRLIFSGGFGPSQSVDPGSPKERIRIAADAIIDMPYSFLKLVLLVVQIQKHDRHRIMLYRGGIIISRYEFILMIPRDWKSFSTAIKVDMFQANFIAAVANIARVDTFVCADIAQL